MLHVQLKRLNNVYLYVGLIVWVAVVGLSVTNWKWTWLSQLQEDEIYKRWSGLVLVLYICVQLALWAARVTKKLRLAKPLYQWHKKFGVLAPLFFLAHSTTLGYGYLFGLSVAYFSLLAVGLLNREVLKVRNKTFDWAWMILHVALTMIVVLFSCYHVWIAFLYQ